jgi:CubicO group peptidase (beta-lactamase class C family)
MRRSSTAGTLVLLVALLVATVAARTDRRSSQPAADQRFDALVALAEARMREHGVPGLGLGIVQDRTVTMRGLGVTNLDDPLPVTNHTVFPIASVSKTFASTAMMRLVEQGKVDLRAPVRRYLPDFRVSDEGVSRDATVWHCSLILADGKGRCRDPSVGRIRCATSSPPSPS